MTPSLVLGMALVAVIGTGVILGASVPAMKASAAEHARSIIAGMLMMFGAAGLIVLTWATTNVPAPVLIGATAVWVAVAAILAAHLPRSIETFRAFREEEQR
jgi:hypothetical protein